MAAGITTAQLIHAAEVGVRKANSVGKIDPGDIVGGTMVRILEGGWTLDTVDLPLVYTMAYRETVDQIRANAKAGIPVDYTESKDAHTMGAAVLARSGTEDTADIVVEADEMTTLQAKLGRYTEQLLAKLTQQQTLCAREYYLNGRTMADAAKALGMTHKALSRHLEKARDRLGPEASDLALLRKYLHPDAKTPGPWTKAEASPALRALFS